MILGLDGLLIVLYLLANWHYVRKVWIFIPIKLLEIYS